MGGVGVESRTLAQGEVQVTKPPRCECGEDLVLRTALKGPRAGKQFWGCPKYRDRSKSHTLINIDESHQPASAPQSSFSHSKKRPAPRPSTPRKATNLDREPPRPASRSTHASNKPTSESQLTVERLRPKVMWSDAADFRPGWVCRYTTSGARIRSLPPDVAAIVQRDLSTCWIAATDSGTYFAADEDTNRFVAMCRKVFQRGSAPFVSPDLEAALLDAADFPSRITTRSGQIRVDTPALDGEALVQAVDFAIPSDADPHLDLGSAEEHAALTWFSLYPGLMRRLSAQAPLELLATGLGCPQQGSRRLDFLVSASDGPFVVEIDGEQHSDDPSDEDRDSLMQSVGVRTFRVSAESVRIRDFKEIPVDLIPNSSESWHPLVHGPIQSQRLVTAMLEGVQRGFLAGNTWCIRVTDPTGLATVGVRSNLDLMAAIDDLWGSGNAPEIIQFVKEREVETWQRSDTGYQSVAHADLDVDLTAYLDLGRGPLAQMPDAVEPTVLIRDAPLLLQIVEPPAPGLIRTAPNGDPGDWDAPLRTILRAVFCLEDFRDGQLPAIREGLAGRDCVVLLPTGAGKSLIYQMVGLLLPGRTLIVDPLVSLMEDQVRSLRTQSIDRVLALSSFTSEMGDSEAALELVQSGDSLFVFLSPERLQIPEFRSSLRQLAATTLINLAVIDEAHCVSEWGHDFRTAYLNVGRTLRHYGQDSQGSPPPILALTGTASRAVLKDVLNDLDITQESPNTLIKPRSFDRPELRFDVHVTAPDMTPATLQGVLRVLPSHFGQTPATFYSPRAHRSHPGLVFVPHINGATGVTQVAKLVEQVTGHEALRYSGTPPKGVDSRGWATSKRLSTAKFMDDEVPVMVTTKAFGMGIDKPNVRYVIHYGIPGSIESYYQEVGRAGRDRDEARCVLIFSEQDARRTGRLLEDSSPLGDIQDHVSSRGRSSSNQDDIDRQLWFFTRSFKGEQSEIDAVLAVLGLLEPYDSTHTCRLAFGDDKQDTEQALHRLAILGLVRDYTVDWGAKRFEVTVSESTTESVSDRLAAFIERSQPGRGQQMRERMSPALRGKTRDALELGTRLITEFIYDTVAQARKRSLREMVLAAREARGNEAEFRRRILDYLQEGEVAPRIEALVDANVFGLGSWIEEILDVDTLDQAQEWRGTAARLLTSYPEQPGLLIGRGYAEFLLPDGDEVEGLANLVTGLRSATRNYRTSDDDVADALTGLVSDRLSAGAPASALALVLGAEQLLQGDRAQRLIDLIRQSSPGLPALAVIDLVPALATVRDQIDSVLLGEE